MDGGVPHCSWGGAACLEGVACLVSWSPSHTAVRQAAVDTTACPSPSCLMQYVVTGRSIITPRCAVHLHVPPCTPGRAAIYIYIYYCTAGHATAPGCPQSRVTYAYASRILALHVRRRLRCIQYRLCTLQLWYLSKRAVADTAFTSYLYIYMLIPDCCMLYPLWLCLSDR